MRVHLKQHIVQNGRTHVHQRPHGSLRGRSGLFGALAFVRVRFGTEVQRVESAHGDGQDGCACRRDSILMMKLRMNLYDAFFLDIFMAVNISLTFLQKEYSLI